MEFLYKITPTRLGMITEGPRDDEMATVNRHFNYLNSLTEQGTVLLFGRTQNRDARTFGIVIFRAESEEEAQSIMKNDPAVKEGMMRAELYPYKVAGLNAQNWPIDYAE
jgi:uncharacterized protein YciI